MNKVRKRSSTLCSFLTLAVKAKEILGRSWESEKIRYWWDCFKASPKKSGWHHMLQWKPDKHQALKKASDTRSWSVMCFLHPKSLFPHLQSSKCLECQSCCTSSPALPGPQLRVTRAHVGGKKIWTHPVLVGHRGQQVPPLPCFSSCNPHPCTGKCYPQAKLIVIVQVDTGNVWACAAKVIILQRRAPHAYK